MTFEPVRNKDGLCTGTFRGLSERERINKHGGVHQFLALSFEVWGKSSSTTKTLHMMVGNADHLISALLAMGWEPKVSRVEETDEEIVSVYDHSTFVEEVKGVNFLLDIKRERDGDLRIAKVLGVSSTPLERLIKLTEEAGLYNAVD